MMAVFMFIMVPRAVVSSGRIQEVLRTEPSIDDPEVPATPPPGRGTLAFRDVEFRYPGAQDPVLRGISLVVEPGMTTAIVGSTGSGKTTLINLIPRFYDVTGGQLDIDGMDVRDDPPRRPVVADRPRPPEGLPVQRHDREQPALRQGRRDRRRALGGPAHRPGRELRPRARRRSRGARLTGRLEPVRRPAPAAGDRPGAGQARRRSTSSTTASPPSTSRPTRSCGRPSPTRSRTRRWSSSPSASARSWAPTGSSSSTAARSSAIGTHLELMATCETYREIVYSQISAEEAA